MDGRPLPPEAQDIIQQRQTARNGFLWDRLEAKHLHGGNRQEKIDHCG